MIIMAHAECKFNKSGQGLFFTTILYGNNCEQFNFVFDCGTDRTSSCSVKKKLSQNVTDFKSITKRADDAMGKLDMLAISHFHEDHISHIPELIKDMSLGVVMIPFVADEVRVLLAAQYIDIHPNGQGYSSDILRLYQDPINYFSEKGAKHVIVCHGDEQDDYQSNPNDPDNQDFIIKTEDTNNYPKEIHWKNGNNLVRVDMNGYEWIFKPYNLPIDYYSNDKQLAYQSMLNEVKDWLHDNDNGGDWHSMLTSKEKRKKLTDIYKKFFTNLNDSSLFVRSWPKNGGVIYDNSMCCCSRISQNILCLYSCDCYMHNRQKVATLLTGDGKLTKDTLPKLSRDGMLGEEYIIQLPHHGSKDNIELNAVIGKIEPCCLLVASYGLKNGHKHPSHQLIYEIINSRCLKYVDVNEDRDFAYTVQWGN
jgi:beta-lactamase superfamily II metal-dependent hydrolase